MNATIALLKSHRSIRKFTNEPIAPEMLEDIVRAGQGAATSSFLQGTTVIRVTRPEVRDQFAALAGNQAYISSAPEFLVFCADLRRSANCCAMNDAHATLGMTEQFVIATVDVALMGQNCVIAAESLGLGICYIGALRNDPAQASRLLELPENVYPVFGLCLGYPDQDPEIKPRLPVSVVMKTDVYSDEHDEAAIREYDAHILEYYRTRTTNRKQNTWSEQMSGLLSKEGRPHMRGFLTDQGFTMR